MIAFDQLTWLHGKPQSSGLLKANPEDFLVVEDLGFAPDGEGEHVLVRILKNGCNTRFVADALAKFLKIHAREVSFAGQKDKHAVTEQWLCARVPGKEMPDLSKFQLEGCQVLEYARHKRKLRLGALKGNQFTVILREISHRQDVETRLKAIAERGVPNYFGAQRFGIGGGIIAFHLILQPGERERQPIHLHTEILRRIHLPAQRVERFSRRELQAEQLPGSVDKLSGRDVARPAELFGVNVLPFRRDEQQLRRPAGQMPCQMRRVHQLHPSRRPERRRHMSLLVRYRVERHPERRRHRLCRALSREEARHVRTLHSPRPRTGSNRRDLRARIFREQCPRQLRQPLHMRKQRV